MRADLFKGAMNMDDVFVVAYEPGQTGAALPTWASARAGLIAFDPAFPPARRHDIAGVPGGFHIENVLSSAECDAFTAVTSRMGYTKDAPVSLPHEVRHNTNVNWVADDSIVEPIWARCQAAFHERLHMTDGSVLSAVGLNARLRFYRYGPGDYFKPHTDGAWPGSKVIDGRLTPDAYGGGCISWFTLLLFLSDGYEGGGTRFYIPAGAGEPGAPPVEVSVKTPKGWALVFPHGHHPLHCLHAGEPVISGAKDIIRTDVLFV
ncbi:MAG: prolyl hydroxylase family protein [Rhodospirillales bacterium]